MAAATPRRPASSPARPSRSAAKRPAAKPSQTPRRKPAKTADPVAVLPEIVLMVKPHKQKLVRDSFTIPRDEYTEIATLKQRAARLGHLCKKSEVLRAGLKALAAMDDAHLLGVLHTVPSLKTGRPAAEMPAGESAATVPVSGARKK